MKDTAIHHAAHHTHHAPAGTPEAPGVLRLLSEIGQSALFAPYIPLNERK